MSGEERTEAPTPRRRAEARNRGQVPKSAEAVAALGILAAFVLLRWWAPEAFSQMRDFMHDTYRALSREDLTPLALGQLGWSATLVLAKAIAPLSLGLLLCGVVINVLQTGPLFSFAALKPDFKRLNPIKGLGRMFSGRAWFDLAKSLAKVAACGIVLYQVAQERSGELLVLGRLGTLAALAQLADIVTDMGLKVGALLAVAAVLDYGYQRFSYERSLRMTRHEVKEELRSSEGDPSLKGHIRSQMRAMAQRRMMQAVPAADVIVVNPTHLAIALKYDPDSPSAPRVVAKGERLMAERIIKVAKEHRVTIVRNIPLAHALYRTVEIGAEIPASLYKAVAEVLAFVYRLRQEQRLRAAG